MEFSRVENSILISTREKEKESGNVRKLLRQIIEKGSEILKFCLLFVSTLLAKFRQTKCMSGTGMFSTAEFFGLTKLPALLSTSYKASFQGDQYERKVTSQ